MNTINQKIVLFLSLLCCTITALKGAVGCMDNSQYLCQRFDTKAYHYVQCDCPCRSKAPGTNRCARCGHLRVPQEEEYVTQVDGMQAKRSKFNKMMENPDEKLQRLIERYRETSKKY